MSTKGEETKEKENQWIGLCSLNLCEAFSIADFFMRI